jgi:hypothetical protein
MNNSQQQEVVYYEERFKKLRDFLRRTGFTGNVPFSLDFMSLPSNEKAKFIDEARAIFAYLENISPSALLELFQLLNVEYDTSDDDDDDNIEVSGG